MNAIPDTEAPARPKRTWKVTKVGFLATIADLRLQVEELRHRVDAETNKVSVIARGAEAALARVTRWRFIAAAAFAAGLALGAWLL